MTDDRMNEAFRQVGQFMFVWAALEAELNRGLQKILRLDGIDGHIVTANMAVRDKIHVMRTLVNRYGLPHSEWVIAANKTLSAIGDSGVERNLVAHNQFFATENGNVVFFVIKAKGKFAIPDVVWTEADFADKNAAMLALRDKLKADVEIIVKRRATLRGADALPTWNAFAPPPPMRERPELEILGAHIPQSQLHQSSPPTIPQKAPQRSKVRREKPNG